MPYFRSNAMGGTCIGAHLELNNSKQFPSSPSELVKELTLYVGSAKIPVIVTFNNEEPFRKVLNETGFIAYKGRNNTNIHCIDPVTLNKIRFVPYQVHIDAVERGREGQLEVGDTAFFGTNIEAVIVSNINLNSKKELVGVRIERMVDRRVVSFVGFTDGQPYTYSDTYGWDRKSFMRTVYE